MPTETQAAADRIVFRAGGHEIPVSHPDKPLWPEMGITKAAYIRRLAELSPWLLPHCAGRFLTTIRYPDGVQGGTSFYQKNSPEPTPGFVRTVMAGDIRYVVLDSLPTLAWLGSLYCLEFHVSCERIDDPLPDRYILDIDPSREEEPRLMEATALIGDLFDTLGLQAVPKTSGATGVQIVLPVARGPTFDDLRRFGRFICEYLVARYPDLFTIARRKKDRGDKIYLDYLQFYLGKTLAAPYTPRARPGAPVSAPLEWEEVRRNVKPADFHLNNIVERLREKGDLLAAVPPQNLTAILQSISRR